VSDSRVRPRIVGRYAIYDKIASGGMATVHIGRLLGPVGFARTVAVKCMRSEVAEDPEFVSMFLDEARLAGRINHPNVVAVLDVVAQAGELFLVMEYVKGESLACLLRATRERGAPMPPEMAVTTIVGVLHGLHAAHEARGERGEPLGVVHRDISPQNVLCGVDGVARVVDFGVAKAAGRIQTTRKGQLKGKMAYMAPEQLSGTVSRATDVYAASVVLWEALAGRRLFMGENDAEVFGRVLRGNVPAPSAVAPHALPPVLDEIVLRGLNGDPEKRWVTAYEMARALEDAMVPVTASKIGEWVRDTVRDVLAQRERMVEVVEGSSAEIVSEPPTKRALGGASSRPPPVIEKQKGAESLTGDVTTTQLSSGSVSAPGATASSRSRRLLPGLGVAAGAVALVAVVLLAALSQHHGPLPSAAGSASAPAAPLPSATAAASQASGPPAAMSAPTPSMSANAAVAPVAPPPPQRRPSQSAPARPAPTATTKHSVYDHM
jgi:serine/threonine-protein kinase